MKRNNPHRSYKCNVNFIFTSSNPDETSCTSSQPPKKKKSQIVLGGGIPNLPGVDDPVARRRAFIQWVASTQPKFSPCPPTASESFLHELPVDGKIAVNEKVPAQVPVDDLAARKRQCLLDAFSNAVMCARKRSNIMEIPVCDKVAEDDLVNDFDVDSRRHEAERFRRSYTYGCNDTMDQKTCISSSGTCNWLEKSSGITWVAVHGINSICLVTRNEALDVTRLGNFLRARKQHVCLLLRETLISEMEDLADPSSEARQNIHQSFDKPFAVVSLIPAGTNKTNAESGTEASGGVYDENRAINFLQEKMKSSSTLTYGYSETLQMAISAFLLLFDKELKAKDIVVCIWAKGLGTQDLWIRDAEDNLVVMYKKGIETLVERLPK